MMAATGACSRHNANASDSALNSDLSLAAQQRAASDSLSAAERTDSLNANSLTTTHPMTHTASSAGEVSHVHHTVHHVSSGSEGSSSGTVTTTTTTSGGTVVKHTQRDAAIGAAAGAVIGATTSHSKVKGGIIGAAVGGILGGVIGNNVDKKKKP
jgi:hypothetical protein